MWRIIVPPSRVGGLAVVIRYLLCPLVTKALSYRHGQSRSVWENRKLKLVVARPRFSPTALQVSSFDAAKAPTVPAHQRPPTSPSLSLDYDYRLL